MINNKKSLLWNIGLVIIFFVVMSSAYLLLSAKYEQLSKSQAIGEKQLTLINVYLEGEKLKTYFDLASKFASVQAYYDLGKSGGYYPGKNDCGNYYGYALWSYNNTECYPANDDIENNFKLYFTDAIKSYINDAGVVLPKDDFMVNIKNNDGNATDEVIILSRKKVFMNFRGYHINDNDMVIKIK